MVKGSGIFVDGSRGFTVSPVILIVADVSQGSLSVGGFTRSAGIVPLAPTIADVVM
jgi:hypothetical protein